MVVNRYSVEKERVAKKNMLLSGRIGLFLPVYLYLSGFLRNVFWFYLINMRKTNIFFVFAWVESGVKPPGTVFLKNEFYLLFM